MNLDLLQYDDSRTLAKKRLEILISAKDLFIQKGIEQTSMQMIAEKAGITRRSLYNYYESKEKIAIDVQIVNLDEISWFSGWDYRNAETPGDGMAEAFMINVKKAFGEFRSHYIYIIRFDTYFCNGYPDSKYVDYLQSEIGKIIGGFETMEESVSSEILNSMNLLMAYLQRMILRGERKSLNLSDLEEEARLFGSMFRELV